MYIFSFSKSPSPKHQLIFGDMANETFNPINDWLEEMCVFEAFFALCVLILLFLISVSLLHHI